MTMQYTKYNIKMQCSIHGVVTHAKFHARKYDIYDKKRLDYSKGDIRNNTENVRSNGCFPKYDLLTSPRSRY